MENLVGPTILFMFWFMSLLGFFYLHPFIGVCYLIGCIVVWVTNSD